MDYNIILENQAKKHGKWILKSFADRKIDIDCIELENYSRRLAWWMKANGIQKGDKVGCWMGNTPEFLMIVVACWRIGAVCVPLNFYEHVEYVEQALKECNAKLFVWDSNNKYIKKQNTEMLTGIDVAKEPLCGKCRFGFLEEVPQNEKIRCEMNVEDELVILYTSGSTGDKKGIYKSQKSFWGQKGFQSFYSKLLDFAKLIHPLHLVNCYPWYHNTGMSLLSATANGGLFHEITAERFRILDVVEYVNKYKPNLWLGTSSMLYRCCAQSEGKLKRIPAIMILAGEGLSRATVEALESYSGGQLLYSGYGTTEAGNIANIWYRFCKLSIGMKFIVWILKRLGIIKHLLRLNDFVLEDCASVLGDINTYADVLIYDETCNMAVIDGESGEICVDAHTKLKGYVGEQDISLYLEYDGKQYVRTGDIGYKKSNMLFLSGRKKNMIIRSGENIIPAEIEQIIENMSGVRDVVVCGIPDKNYGEVICACIETEEMGFDLEVVKKAVQEKLPKYMFPQYFELVDEIPMNASGKKDVRKMREIVLEKLEKSTCEDATL